MSQPPKEPADFGSPDFLGQPAESPPEEGLFGMGAEPSPEPQVLETPMEEGPAESTASVEIPVESPSAGLELTAEQTAPSVEIPEEQPETPAEEEEEEEAAGPTFWQRLAEQLDRYTVILLLSLLAITTAIVLLGLELSAYQWDIGAKSAR